MKRSVYEAPVTERFQIEMEGGFCSGSADVQNPNNKETGRIEEHGFSTNFNADNFSGGSWTDGE